MSACGSRFIPLDDEGTASATGEDGSDSSGDGSTDSGGETFTSDDDDGVEPECEFDSDCDSDYYCYNGTCEYDDPCMGYLNGMPTRCQDDDSGEGYYGECYWYGCELNQQCGDAPECENLPALPACDPSLNPASIPLGNLPAGILQVVEREGGPDEVFLVTPTEIWNLKPGQAATSDPRDIPSEKPADVEATDLDSDGKPELAIADGIGGIVHRDLDTGTEVQWETVGTTIAIGPLEQNGPPMLASQQLNSMGVFEWTGVEFSWLGNLGLGNGNSGRVIGHGLTHDLQPRFAYARRGSHTIDLGIASPTQDGIEGTSYPILADAPRFVGNMGRLLHPDHDTIAISASDTELTAIRLIDDPTELGFGAVVPFDAAGASPALTESADGPVVLFAGPTSSAFVPVDPEAGPLCYVELPGYTNVAAGDIDDDGQNEFVAQLEDGSVVMLELD